MKTNEVMQMALEVIVLARCEYEARNKSTAKQDAALTALRLAIIIEQDRTQRQAGQEPTEEMIRAGCLSQQATPEYDNYDDWCSSHSGGIIERIRGHLRKDFCAMLAAAPQPAAQPDKDAEIAALKDEEVRILAASRYTADLCTQALDTVREQEAEIAALKAIVASYIAYDEADHNDDVKMMLDYADMLAASRAVMAQAVQPLSNVPDSPVGYALP